MHGLNQKRPPIKKNLKKFCTCVADSDKLSGAELCSTNHGSEYIHILVGLIEKCSAVVAISRRKFGIIQTICHYR